MPRAPNIIQFPAVQRPPESVLDVSHLLRPAAPVTTGKNKVLDLKGVRTALLVVGAGNTGKTTWLRWACERALARDLGFPLSLASVDPVNRTLVGYFPGVDVPNTTNTAGWLNLYLSLIMSGEGSAAIDFGAGNLSLLDLVHDTPAIDKTMRASGIEPVLVLPLSPRTDDLTMLEALDQAGFQPRATLLVLNLGLGTPDEFALVREHSVYQAALGRGAVEVWMPRNHGARMVEAWKLGFGAAVSDERLAMLDRSRVKVWLEDMESAFSVVGGWLP